MTGQLKIMKASKRHFGRENSLFKIRDANAKKYAQTCSIYREHGCHKACEGRLNDQLSRQYGFVEKV